MIELRARAGALLLPVRVAPGAARAAIGQAHDGRLKVAVNAAPERGKANKQLIALLARALGCARSAISIVSGQTHRDKLVAIEGDQLAALEALCGGQLTVAPDPQQS